MRAVAMVAGLLCLGLSVGGLAADEPKKSEPKRDKVGNGFHIETQVQAQDDGKIVGKSVFKSTNDLLGFTGGVVAMLVDKEGNKIFPEAKKVGDFVTTKGVNAKAEASKEWAIEYPKELFDKIDKIEIYHHHVPKDKIDEFVEKTKKILEVAGKAADLDAKLKGLPSGG